MKWVRLIVLAAASTCTGQLHAQDCSGGPGGGADATGNQCNTPADASAPVEVSRAGSSQPTVKMSGTRAAPIAAHVHPVTVAASAGAARTSKASPAPEANSESR